MSQKKILVIDDNPVVLKLNESLLVKGGYEVLTATDGISGLKIAQKEIPDYIFLDIILPELHGFEVCKRLKSDERTKHIPVIIITGTGLEDIAKDEPDVDAQGYIAKPYGADEIEKTIARIDKDTQNQ